MIHTKKEIEKLKKANERTSELHLQIQQRNWVGKMELDMLDFLEKEKTADWAFSPIIASGPRGKELHAKPSCRAMEESDWVIVDIGLKVDGYCSDITRTWPIGQGWTTEQKKIYDLVLKSQTAGIQMAQRGSTLEDVHLAVCQTLDNGLSQLGIEGELTNYFPHRTSHWISREVHAPFPYQDANQKPVLLEEGMAFTIEPGLYFGDQQGQMNVRIEDSFIMTSDGAKKLSQTPHPKF